MRKWLRRQLDRRSLLYGGAALSGGSLLGTATFSSRPASQGAPHSGHGGAAADRNSSSAPHHAAHGNMITVGDVDIAKNGFDPTAMLSDWDTGKVSRLPDGRTLRTFEVIGVGQGDRDRAGHLLPGLDLQRPRPGSDAARHRGRPRAHRLPQQRLASALDALPRHPLRPHGRRSRRRR